jgi:hypothetical protein
MGAAPDGAVRAWQVMAALERAVTLQVFHLETVGLVNVVWAWATLQYSPQLVTRAGWMQNNQFMRRRGMVFTFDTVRLLPKPDQADASAHRRRSTVVSTKLLTLELLRLPSKGSRRGKARRVGG